ncbi:MAG TPA: hypothetical protein VE359_10855 [Vicinamibacteria bacterium]|nr:hypothetical protein [Vicinamibacteria bacterium]
MRRSRSPWGPAPFLLAALVSACGGSGGSPTSGTPASPPASAGSANPCTAALGATGGVAASVAGRSPKSDGFGHDDRDPREFLALHLLPRDGGVSARAASSSASRSGDIAVVSDDGSIVIGANPFDLGGAALRFDPNGQGGYDVRRASGGFRPDLGRRARFGDDDTREEAFGFSFRFYGAARASAFVNSDGNLTFGGGDVETTARSLGRVLSGAPRVAPFFADLDPSAGGGIFVNAASDAFTVTWCAVPDFDATGKVTAQASLLPGGAVEIRIDASTTLKDAVVALSPGATSVLAAVDLSAASGGTAGGPGAVGERFAAEASLDLVAASRRFYAEFPDNYDQILFWSDTRVVESGTFAFETTVQNAITGIGQEVVSFADAYGSGGRLSSLVVMDDLGKYPADPVQRANGENNTLALVAHETGHRWGATLQFRDASGASSDAWLGRQRAHWSFFCDSDASVLEGNEVEDQGGGSFRTTATVSRYGPFDLYAMGLLGESEAPRAFYVESPSGASQDRESPPRTGIAFTGTRREVSIGDVVAAMGPRNPPASSSPRTHRQAWVYVVGRGRTADPAAIAKLETIRRAFEGFFSDATGGRMSVETRLD